MTTLTDIARKTTKGTAFLIEESAPQDIFTPEDLSEEHLAVGHMVDEFWANEVEPNLPAIREKKPGVAMAVLRKSVELGLTAMAIPEEYGGMAMDLPSLMVTAERMGRDGSYGGWHSAHTGIGTLPIVYFGNEQQKRKYLPKLAKVEMLAAYALTEPLAGSDALAARTRADLAPDGKHYILNGQKMWITNGGAADLFTVFAKVGGEKFTAFLVERNFPGVSSGAEEHKMGITGSSTTAVYLDNVPVPVENVLGRNWPRARDRIQHPEHRTPETGSGHGRSREKRARDLPEVCQAAQGIRLDDFRVRRDSTQAGGNGDPHFRGGVDDLARGGTD